MLICQYANAFRQHSAANWHIGKLTYWHIIHHQLLPAFPVPIRASTVCLYRFAPSAMFLAASFVPMPYAIIGVFHTIPA